MDMSRKDLSIRVDCPQDKTWDHCTSSPWRCWYFGPKGLSECKMEEHTITIGKDHNLLCKNSPQIYCPVAGKTFQTKESQVSSKKVTLCWRDPACKCLISELRSDHSRLSLPKKSIEAYLLAWAYSSRIDAKQCLIHGCEAGLLTPKCSFQSQSSPSQIDKQRASFPNKIVNCPCWQCSKASAADSTPGAK